MMHIGFLNPQGNFDPNDSYWTEHPDFGGQLVYVKEVALALGTSGGKEMVDELMKALGNDSSAQVRWRAALSIGKLGDDSVVGELERLLTTEEDSQARGHIREAIVQLEKQ